MFKLAKPFFIKVITPLHAGSGQDLGIVDMPIQRERHTGFPKIEASGLKGSFREAFKESKEEISVGKEIVKDENREKSIFLTFGPDPKNGDSHAGSLGFTDAKILLFPVKSMKGVFAYISCPSVIERFKKDLIISGTELEIGISSPNSIACQKKDSSVVIEKQNRVVLEEYSFEVVEDSSTAVFGKWVENILGENIQKKLVVLSDEDFRDFVNLATEVITRTRIDPETGTVKGGALFTEEYLPSETILYSLALTTPIFNGDKGVFKEEGDKKEEDFVMDFFENGVPDVMQIGGNATIGKGVVEITMEAAQNGK